MKQFFFSVLILLAFTVVALRAAEPIVLFDAGSNVTWFTSSDEADGNTLEFGEIDARPVLWFEYNRAETPWSCASIHGDIAYRRIPEFKAGHFEVDIYLPPEAGASWISFRFYDKDDEMINNCFDILKANLPVGWSTITLPVNPQKPYSTWGGKVTNHVIDFPARFDNLAIDYIAKIATGRLAIARIAFVIDEE